jgi:ribonuclease BN (tRNA processing enzyme)
MHRFTLKCFGVGDGWPSADRGHSAFLYRLNGCSVLIDCGESISRSFKASGLSYDLIDDVFLSHLHFDHVGGFFMLVQGFWLERRAKPLTVYAPEDGIPSLRQMLEAGCIFEELLPFRLQFKPLKLGQSVRIGSTQVTPFLTSHLAHLQKMFQAKYPQQFAAFCFRINTDSVRLAHSADIGAPEDLEPLLDGPVSLLVCELAHVHPQELFAYLQGRPIKRICFVHLGRECRQRLGEVKALAARMLPDIQLSFPDDGAEECFSD